MDSEVLDFSRTGPNSRHSPSQPPSPGASATSTSSTGNHRNMSPPSCMDTTQAEEYSKPHLSHSVKAEANRGQCMYGQHQQNRTPMIHNIVPYPPSSSPPMYSPPSTGYTPNHSDTSPSPHHKSPHPRVTAMQYDDDFDDDDDGNDDDMKDNLDINSKHPFAAVDHPHAGTLPAGSLPALGRGFDGQMYPAAMYPLLASPAAFPAAMSGLAGMGMMMGIPGMGMVPGMPSPTAGLTSMNYSSPVTDYIKGRRRRASSSISVPPKPLTKLRAKLLDSSERSSSPPSMGSTNEDMDNDSSMNHEESDEPDSKRRKTIQEMKDEMYWDRRKKNNEAAKRSRDARRVKETEVMLRTKAMEAENITLNAQVDMMRKEVEQLKQLLYHTNA